MIASCIDWYAQKETTYFNLSTEHSEMEAAEAEYEVCVERLPANVERVERETEAGCSPSPSTIFYWLEAQCCRVERLLNQLQKELILGVKRGRAMAELPKESTVENPNSYKAATATKEAGLNSLTFGVVVAGAVQCFSRRQWYRLRAYFLAKAESRFDLLTRIAVRLPITQTFELAII
jgi:hypothetical protein